MTILLIPGLLCDGFVWAPLRARLDAEVADVSTQDSIAAMAEACLAAHPGTLRVAGHSMGARVAMEMARLAPERIERLALLDTGTAPLRPGEREKRDEIVAFSAAHGMAALAARWLPPMVWEANRTEALMRGLTEMVLRAGPEQHARQIGALIARPDASAHLGEIRCPVLLVCGREDAWSPLAQHEQMLGLLPDARLEVIENAGHFAPVEQPEAVAELLAGFLGDTR